MVNDMGEFDDLDDVPSKGRVSFGGSKIKWETVLPVVVIILVVLLIIFKTNIFSAGLGLFSSGKGMTMLVIGSPTQEFKAILSDAENRDLIQNVRYSDTQSLEHNPYERIKGYNIIILDQSNQTDKTISRSLGEAITAYVRNGGKLIVVGNSGIERPGDVSVLGWKATFGDIVPVGCEPTTLGIPSCKRGLYIHATIHAAKEDHPIMYGILRVPALESAGYLYTETFDVPIYGSEIAYVKDEVNGKVYTGIVEKQNMLGGKVIYFNFNPGLSNAIFVNTLQYLK